MAPRSQRWTFISNHGHVLLCLAKNEAMLMKDVAAAVGITLRAVQRIVTELETGGYLVRVRDGRQNRYVVRRHVPLRHPLEAHREVGALIALVEEDS